MSTRIGIDVGIDSVILKNPEGGSGGPTGPAGEIVDKIEEVGGFFPPDWKGDLQDLIDYLEENGLFSKILLWKGLVGQTAASHALNWVDLENVNGFQTIWNGSLALDGAHSFYGTTSNGTTADFGQEGFIPSTDFPSIYGCGFIASHTPIVGVTTGFLSVSQSGTQQWGFGTGPAGNVFASQWGTGAADGATNTVIGTSLGSFTTNRPDATNLKTYNSGALLDENPGAVIGTPPTIEVHSFGANGGGAGVTTFPFAGTLGMWCITDILTEEEALLLDRGFNAWLQRIGRYVHPDVWAYLSQPGKEQTDNWAIRIASEARMLVLDSAWDKTELFVPILPQYSGGALLNMKNPAAYIAVPTNNPQLDAAGYRFVDSVEMSINTAFNPSPWQQDGFWLTMGYFMRTDVPLDVLEPRCLMGSESLNRNWSMEFLDGNTFRARSGNKASESIIITRPEEEVRGMITYHQTDAEGQELRLNKQIVGTAARVSPQQISDPVFINGLNKGGIITDWLTSTCGGYFIGYNYSDEELSSVEDAMIHINNKMGRGKDMSDEADAYVFSAGANSINLRATEAASKIGLIELELANGNWAKYDMFQIYAVDNPVALNLTFGLKNGFIGSPSVVNVTDINVLGAKGDGLTGYIDTGFIPSVNGVNLSLNNASYNVFATEVATTAGSYISATNLSIRRVSVSSTRFSVHDNTNTDTGGAADTDIPCLFSTVRTGGDKSLEINGVIVNGQPVAVTAIPIDEVRVLSGNAALFLDGRIASLAIGSDTIDRVKLSENIQKYLISLTGGGNPNFSNPQVYSQEVIDFANLYNITSRLELDALEQLLHDLKGDERANAGGQADLWTNAVSVLPISLTSFAASLGNFRNNAVPAISIGSDPAHSNAGWTFDAVANAIDSGIKMAVSLPDATTLNNLDYGVSIYNSNPSLNAGAIAGTKLGSGNSLLSINPQDAPNVFSYVGMDNIGGDYKFPAAADSSGLIHCQSKSNVKNIYRQRTLIGSDAVSTPGTTAPNITIGAYNVDGVTSDFSDAVVSFVYLGAAMTDANQQSQLYKSIRNYNRALGRGIADDSTLQRNLEDYLTVAGITGPESDAIQTFQTRMNGFGTPFGTNVFTTTQYLYPISQTDHFAALQNLRQWNKPLVSLGADAVFSATGLQFNGVEAYNTGIVIQSDMPGAGSYGLSAGVYNGLALFEFDLYDFGVRESTSTQFSMQSNWDGQASFVIWNQSNAIEGFTPGNQGLSIMTSQNSDEAQLYISQYELAIRTTDDNGNVPSAQPVYLGALNVGGGDISNGSFNEVRFFFMANIMNYQNVVDMNFAVEELQTYYGRAVAQPLVLVNPAEVEPYIEAGFIRNYIEIKAVDQLVTDLKLGAINGSDNWTPAVGIMPISPTSLFASRQNLKDVLKPMTSISDSPGSHSFLGILTNENIGTLYTGPYVAGVDYPLDNVSAFCYAQGGSFIQSGRFCGFEETGSFYLRQPDLDENYEIVVTGARIPVAVNTNDGFWGGTLEPGLNVASIRNNVTLNNFVTDQAIVGPATLEWGFIGQNEPGIRRESISDSIFQFSVLFNKALVQTEIDDLWDAVERYQGSLGRSYAQPVYDYITKHNITNSIQKAALYELYDNMRWGLVNGYDTWTNAYGVYPINTSSHAAAIDNMRNLDLPLLSQGFDATPQALGLEFVAANTEWYDTGINPLDFNGLIPDSLTLAAYTRTEGTNPSPSIGARQTNNSRSQLSSNNGGVASYASWGDPGSDGWVEYGTDNGSGFSIGVRDGSQLTVLKNGVAIDKFSGEVFGTPPNQNLYINTINNAGLPYQYNSDIYSFLYIGRGMLDPAAYDLYWAVQTYNTRLSREIPFYTFDNVEAKDFCIAYDISDLTFVIALDNFVTNLKVGLVNANDIWTAVFTGGVIWPFAGAAEFNHKGNLRDPSTFEIVSFSSGTHSVTGWDNLGAGFADTGIIPSTFSAGAVTLSCYLARDETAQGVHIGVFETSPTEARLTLSARWTSGLLVFTPNTVQAGPILSVANPTNISGLTTVSRDVAGNLQGWNNEISLGTNLATNLSMPSVNPIYLGAMRNAASSSNPVNNEFRIAAIAPNGMTVSQQTDWFAAVRQYQIEVGRATPDSFPVEDFILNNNITETVEVSALTALGDHLNGIGTPNGTDLWTNAVSIMPISRTSAVAARDNLRSTGVKQLISLPVPVDPVFSVTGLSFNGLQAYDTQVVPSVDLTTNDVSVVVYQGLNEVGAGEFFGSDSDSNTSLMITFRSGNQQESMSYAASGGSRFSGVVEDTSGLMAFTRRSDSDAEMWRESTSFATGLVLNGGTTPTIPIYLGGRNLLGALTNGITNEIRFLYIGASLTAAAHIDLRFAIRTYQEALGRAIPPPALDPDAQLFISTYGITGETEMSALDQLCKDLKVGTVNGTDTWTPSLDIMPFTLKDYVAGLGNLRTIAQPLLEGVGGVGTHSNLGLQISNGNPYVLSRNPSIDYTLNNYCVALYLGGGSGTTTPYLAGTENSPTARIMVQLNQDSNGDSRFDCYTDGSVTPGRLSFTLTGGAQGCIITNRRSAIDAVAYQNNAIVGSTILGAGALPNIQMCFGGGNAASTGAVNNSFRFYWQGTGLTDLQVADLTAAIETYQVTLARSTVTPA